MRARGRLTGLGLAASGAALLLASLASLGASGCTTSAFCFDGCQGAGGGSTSEGEAASTSSGVGGLDINPTGTGGAAVTIGAGGGQECAVAEVCNGLDDDCDGIADNGITLDTVQNCGTCEKNCISEQIFCADIVCDPGNDPGNTPGTCSCNECLPGYYDLDPNTAGCEYPCIPDPSQDESFCNNKDDNCNGQKDEDVDFCDSVDHCGVCGRECNLLNATPKCVHTGSDPCDGSNTSCEIAQCICTGAGNCFFDANDDPSDGCEYKCDKSNGGAGIGIEACGDGIDNDCDTFIDDADPDPWLDPNIGVTCQGGTEGICADPSTAGMTACAGSTIVCQGPNVVEPGDNDEVCDGIDNDCDGLEDDEDTLTDVGDLCPAGAPTDFPCAAGVFVCDTSVSPPVLDCSGEVPPGVEACNGIDDDCDGDVDLANNVAPADSVGACDVPIAPPAGMTSPCSQGTKACQNGIIQCNGSQKALLGAVDTCGVDANCNGINESQVNTMTDSENCGTCGNDCNANQGTTHSIFTCVNGGCSFQGCQGGFHDTDNDDVCDYACTFQSSTESCNNQDDDCDGVVDNGAVPPTAQQLCGVSGLATSPECTGTGQGGQIQIVCQSGGWICQFPAGVCSPSCAGATEICDGVDNDCDGATNENVANYGQPCASDDGQPVPGHGACRTTGIFDCDGDDAVICNAVKADCNDLADGCTEECDGEDNDCDGLIDEAFNNPGSNAQNFVRPRVTQFASNKWVMSFEASRPTATDIVPGSGNGYECVSGSANCNFNVNGTNYTVPSAPANTPLDKTPACSVPDKIPWFNVTGVEVEHVCKAIGGRVCTTAEFTTTCQPASACDWGYAPRIDGADGGSTIDCAQGFTASKFCNLGPSYDFAAAPGEQDGLLPTGSPLLQNCWADWSGLQGNGANDERIFDLTGNLREITRTAAGVYTLMGGAFDTHAENGATCEFTFYAVDGAFQFPDTGFRCCFDADPT